MHFVHEPTNLKVGGGLDDVWYNTKTEKIHIVDYKSTAQLGKHSKPLNRTFLAPPSNPLAPDYKAAYRRQLDMYQWVARRLGFQVSDTGYFVYVDGQHREESGMLDPTVPAQAWMRFNLAVIPLLR